MPEHQFTENQQGAIEQLNRHCVVTAGPGAGKTRVLVERVIHILRQRQAGLDQIVAITFTNKAANEMKERLRQKLGELAGHSRQRADGRYWDGLKRQLESATISTIHGFCSGILRVHPVQAKVDPAFATLDDYTSRLLLIDAAQATVTALVNEQDAAAARLVVAYGRQELVSESVRLFEKVRSLGLTFDQLKTRTSRALNPPEAYADAVAALRQCVHEILSENNLTTTMQRQVEELAAAWEKYQVQFPPTPTIERSRRFSEMMERLSNVKPHSKGRLKEPAEAYREQLERVELVYYDGCTPEILTTIVKALRRMEERYKEAKEARRSLDYEDLQWKARDLLITYPWLARQYAERYRFVLVDEIQDTNGLQKEILDLLIGSHQPGDPQASALDSQSSINLFIVGDQKQSIYLFRGAEVEVFDETADELQQRGAEPIELDTNFRSTAGLVAFFNAFFSRAMILDSGEDEAVMQQLGYVSYHPGRPHRPLNEAGACVELMLDIGEHVGSADEAREHEGERIAVRLWEMVHDQGKFVGESNPNGAETTRPVRFGDIAILFRALTDIKVYELALRRAGIPYMVLAGRGFYEREEIQDIVALMRFLENRTDDIALVSALRAPLFGLSDETLYWLRVANFKSQISDPKSQQVDHHPLLTNLLRHEEIQQINDDQCPLVSAAAAIITRLLSLRNRIPLADLLEEILVTTDYAALQATKYDGTQRVANLAKLTDLARGFEAGGPHFLTDFVRYIQQFTEMETREAEAQTEMGRQDVVQLMTIHKAKGLEFPVVVLPDLARKLTPKSSGLPFDREIGVGLQVPDARGMLHDTALRQRVVDNLEQRERFENQRVLFVAATRARDYLILAGSATNVKTSRSLSEAASWLEWVCTILQIENAASLGESHEWEGIPIKITPGSELNLDQLRESSTLIVDRYPEIRQGQPLSSLPMPSPPEQIKRIGQWLQPLPAVPDGGSQSLAVTRLLSFARCPLQYYYETVLGLPDFDQYEGDPGEADPRPKTQDPRPGRLSATDRGKIFHSFCELYDGKEDSGQVISAAIERNGTLNPGARAQAVAEIHPLAQRYLNSSLYREIERLQQSDIGRVESEVDFIYRANGLLLRGRIDKLLVDEDGAATVVDFKTNRITAEQVEAAAQEYELQMKIYALAVKRVMKLSPVRAELYFLKPEIRFEVNQQRLDESLTAQELDELSQQVLRIRRAQDAVARPSPERCHYCRCASFCPSRAM
ncbi:MAG: UvrD-helicase domain-containing protein [Gammaproteobacteria bacterium]